jgi:hypothetical protein
MLFEILLNFGVVLRTQWSLHFGMTRLIISMIRFIVIVIISESVALRGVKILSVVHRVFQRNRI